MSCDLKKEDLLTFFYGECEEGEQVRIKEHVAACEPCRRELAALASTQALLRGWPDESPQFDLTFVEPEMPRRRFRLIAGLAAAAAVVVALFVAWPEFELSYRAGALDLKWGEALADQPLTRAEVLAAQEGTLALMNQMLRVAETRQHQLLTEIQAQRYQDLQLINHQFQQLDRDIHIRLQRNEPPVLELLPAVRYTNP